MDIFLIIILQNEREHINNIRYSRRVLRDASDPFSLLSKQLSKECVRDLITELRPFMPVRIRIGVPCELMVLASLNFMASGSCQRRVGQDYLTCMSQTTISDALHATVNSLNQIMRNWICFPTTAERRNQIKEEFYRRSGFPGVIGAIDSTHIAIISPEVQREYLFVNSVTSQQKSNMEWSI